MISFTIMTLLKKHKICRTFRTVGHLGTLHSYFYSYKTEVFPFQHNPKNLDPYYKLDLDFWGMIWKGDIHIIANFHKGNPIRYRGGLKRFGSIYV